MATTIESIGAIRPALLDGQNTNVTGAALLRRLSAYCGRSSGWWRIEPFL